MAKVYLLYDYEEHGPEDIVATLDASALGGLVKANFPEYADRLDTSVEDALRRSEDEDGGIKLQRGWGGLVLRVVELS